MFKKSFLHLYLSGFLMWLIPFVISFLFYNQNGQLQINYWIFKLMMVFVGVVSAYFVLGRYFKFFETDWKTVSAIVFIINIILDLIVLVGGLKMEIWFYFISIVPVYAVFMPLTTYWVAKHSTYKSVK